MDSVAWLPSCPHTGDGVSPTPSLWLRLLQSWESPWSVQPDSWWDSLCMGREERLDFIKRDRGTGLMVASRQLAFPPGAGKSLFPLKPGDSGARAESVACRSPWRQCRGNDTRGNPRAAGPSASARTHTLRPGREACELHKQHRDPHAHRMDTVRGSCCSQTEKK